MSRCAVVLALALMGSAVTGGAAAEAQAPRISKPRPAPRDIPPMPALPPAAIDNSLAIGGNDIKARQVETRMTVEVMVNGHGPYRFLVDSGADTSVVGLRLAQDLQLPLGTPVILNGMTARSIVDRVRVGELSLGQTSIRNLEVPALKEQDLGGDGMLGIDTLTKQRLMLDFETLLIKVEDPREPVKYLDGEIVITAQRRHGQLILTEARAAGLPIEAVIDTGSEITIGNLALRNKLVRNNRDKFWTVATTGVTGVTVNLEMAVISELRLGPVTLRNVTIAFADVPPFTVFGMSKQPSLLLGTDILATFRRVSLDFEARKVRFQLRKCGSTGVELTTSPVPTLSRLSSTDDVACRR